MSAPKSDLPQGEGETPPAERRQSLAESLAALKSSAQGLAIPPGLLRFLRTGEPPFPRNNWLQDQITQVAALPIPPRTAAGEYLRTIALVEAVRGTLPTESPVERLEKEAERLRRITCPEPPKPGPNPADFHHPPPPPVHRPPTAEEIGAAAARHLPQADPGEVEELRERIAELEARLVPPPKVPEEEQAPSIPPAPLPGNGPIKRRERLLCIMNALQELDPDLDLRHLPGTTADLLELCQALDSLPPKQFSIAPRTLSNCIDGWLAFEHGRKTGKISYYRARLEILRGRLA